MLLLLLMAKTALTAPAVAPVGAQAGDFSPTATLVVFRMDSDLRGLVTTSDTVGIIRFAGMLCCVYL